jgi:serine/threonine protein phosphatase PrpC
LWPVGKLFISSVLKGPSLDIIMILQLSTAGGRLIISSDGVWDALAAETALDCCRGMPADAAAAQIVKVCFN